MFCRIAKKEILTFTDKTSSDDSLKCFSRHPVAANISIVLQIFDHNDSINLKILHHNTCSCYQFQFKFLMLKEES